MTSAARWRATALAAALVVNLVVLYAPESPGGPLAGVPALDKVVHLATFASLAWTGVLAGLAPRWWLPLLAGHAVASELVQHLMLPGRSGDPLDALADVAGVLTGWWARASWGSDRTTAGQRAGRPSAGRDPGAG